jgi:hypothetical protein
VLRAKLCGKGDVMETNFDYETQLCLIALGVSEEIWEHQEDLDDTEEDNDLAEFFL